MANDITITASVFNDDRRTDETTTLGALRATLAKLLTPEFTNADFNVGVRYRHATPIGGGQHYNKVFEQTSLVTATEDPGPIVEQLAAAAEKSLAELVGGAQ